MEQQRGGVDAESLGGAGTESLEDEIRASCEFVDECEALGGRQVDADALLALHHLRPSGFGEGHDGPDRVTVERLHLDHPGPEVGEQRRAEWCGVQDRQLEHRDPGKRKVAGGSPATIRGGADLWSSEVRGPGAGRDSGRTAHRGGCALHLHEGARLADDPHAGLLISTT